MWRIGSIVLVALCVVLTVFLILFFRNTSDLVLVNTPAGTIGGVKASDGEYYVFFGIPYGTVNQTNLFGAPTPHPKFNHVFEAIDDSAFCPQISNNRPQGSADCLQLNIFVPTSASIDNQLPIMVYIHGGAFNTGTKSSNSVGPKYLVRHDVILVAINYRLGPYGFMCLDIPEVPGNQGLKDQELAIKWIRKNIAAFGGDVTKITVFGISAGGHSIEFHLLSDNKVLFNNAILQSGSAVAATVFADHDKRAPIRIAEKLGFITNSLTEAITYLSSLETNLVLQASNDLSIVYKPCTEQKFDGVTPFLTRHWVTADIPKAKEMPILLGFCEHELLLMHLSSSGSNISKVIRNRLLDTFTFNDERLNEAIDVIEDFYSGNENLTSDLIPVVTYFDSDFTYIHPIKRTIKKFLESNAKNIFHYMFSYNGGRNTAKRAANVTIGSAAHGDDSGYLFDIQSIPEEPIGNDKLVLDRVTTMWTNFAKFSDPSPETTDLLTAKWTPLTSETYDYLKIDSVFSMKQRPAAERMEFWDKFYVNNEKFQKGFHENYFLSLT